MSIEKKGNGKISIIIVNWNGKKWLKKCISSLESQTYKNFEIIFVDNASTDGSVAYVEKNFPKVKIIQNNVNLGFAGGNNVAINMAQGKYILLINNDTWVNNNFIELLINFYISNKFNVVSPKESDYSEKKRDDYASKIDVLGHSVYIRKKLQSDTSFFLTGVCLFFSKKFYQETGGFDNNFFMYAEEVDWFWRLRLFGKTFSYADNIYINHAGAGSTGTGIQYNLFLWRNQNTLQMLLKNYKWYNLLWVLPVYFFQNIIEIIFFLLLLKPGIAYSYIRGWWFNGKNFNKIMKKRRWVQKNRVVNDKKIFLSMYFGLGKLKHLLNHRI